jgi:glycosyltransferase involved in cell wall biosynthesis
MIPKISMVTPVWNGERFISDTLRSVRDQGDFLFEHIVIDSMSNDATPSIVNSFSDSKLRYFREKDDGIYDGMNRGVLKAAGDIVGIINSDDYLLPGALQAVAAGFNSAPHAGYVVGGIRIIDESGKFVRVEYPRDVRFKSVLGRDWRFYSAFPHPALFVRRAVYESLGLYDLSYRLCADHEFMARIIKAGLHGVSLATEFAAFRLGGASHSAAAIDEDVAIAIKYGVHPFVAKLNGARCKFGRWRNGTFL